MPAPAPLCQLTAAELILVKDRTVGHYEQSAQTFWEGTRDHDVSQNVAALLRHIEAEAPYAILDVGCGPGRDLVTFRDLGHAPVGLDGSPTFVRMAREHAGCEVLLQNLLQLELAPERFDGVFANAVLFHVPTQELSQVLGALARTLKPGGVLFCSNPRGPDREDWNGSRYGAYLSWESWRDHVTATGLIAVEHFYRPAGLAREHQPWLASVWKKPATPTPHAAEVT